MSDWDNFWSSVGNAVEDVAEAVGNAVETAVTEVVNFVEDVVEDVAAAVEEIVEDVGEAVEDVVDWTLNVADDVIFDPVDFITGGAIDIDYENGQFTGELDLGFASAGIGMGQQGFDAHAGFDIGIASGDISYDSDGGFAMGGSVGLDWGPLPYAEGHLNIGEDGTISIGGEVQATLPLPFGSIGFEGSGELHTNADGSFGASSLVDVFADGPGDSGRHLHNESSFERGPDGFSASSDTDVLTDGPSNTGIGSGIGDDRLIEREEVKEEDEEFDRDAYADEVAERLKELQKASDGTERSLSSLSALASSGDLSDSISSGETDMAEVGELVEAEAFDDFTSDIVSSEILESAAEGVWDDVGP